VVQMWTGELGSSTMYFENDKSN